MGRSLSRDEIAKAFGALSRLEPLGEPGGSGECWRATSAELGDVALKVLVHPHEPGRFDREVEGLKRVSSPHVMTLHDAGFVDCGGASRPYLVSGLIEGPSLRDALSARGLGARAGVELLVGLLRGLSALADADVIHRDLKPENVVLPGGDPSHPVIIDLGICRLGASSSLTQYPWYGGTIRYSSPEQLRREPALNRSDVWATGIVVLEAITGVHPYLGSAEVLPEDYLDVIRQDADVPGEVEHVVRDVLLAMTDFAAYRRPSARAALQCLELNGSQ